MSGFLLGNPSASRPALIMTSPAPTFLQAAAFHSDGVFQPIGKTIGNFLKSITLEEIRDYLFGPVPPIGPVPPRGIEDNEDNPNFKYDPEFQLFYIDPRTIRAEATPRENVM